MTVIEVGIKIAIFKKVKKQERGGFVVRKNKMVGVPDILEKTGSAIISYFYSCKINKGKLAK